MVRIKAVEDFKELRAKIKVVGLGGAGGNAVNRMVEAQVRDVELIAANTDAQVLRQNKAALRIQIGEALTKGLGVGGDPQKGRLAALESRDQFVEALQGSDLVFITAGMGGGTGTGAAPVVAQVAREAHALTIGVVSRPFRFEGRAREALAEGGIKEMRSFVDTILVVPNDSIFGVTDEHTPSVEAFRKADDVLRQAIQSITDVITRPGLINVDMNDIKAIMANAGEAHMGVGHGEGADRALAAAKEAITSPLLENVSIDGAKGMIVNIVGDKSVPMAQIDEAMMFISSKVVPEAKIKWGHAIDDAMGERLQITVIATGFPPRQRRGPQAAGGRSLLAPGKPRLGAAPLDWRRPAPPAPGAAPVSRDWDKPAFTHWKLKKLK